MNSNERSTLNPADLSPEHSFGLRPAVAITRGETTESVHCAAVAVVDREGRLIASYGDPHLATYSRSSLKPIQALAAVMRGFPDRFGLTDRHLALACASHSGEDYHVEAAGQILAAIGATGDDLQCGIHIPAYIKPDNGGVPPKATFTTLHNNCSGKHSCMLALARMLNMPLADYLKFDAPTQRLIRGMVAEMTGVAAEDMPHGIDGCSAPNYVLPLSALARGFARLAWATTQAPGSLSEADRAGARNARAMMTYPEMVSGTGRFDLQLVEAAGRRIFSKAGGEAIECVGIPERGWGLALKIGDGGVRAIGPLTVSVLQELGVLDEAAVATLDPVAHPHLKNHRGIQIGTARSLARLKFHD